MRARAFPASRSAAHSVCERAFSWGGGVGAGISCERLDHMVRA